jgi:hypothetical protein
VLDTAGSFPAVREGAPVTNPDEYSHLIVADTHPLPSLDEVEDYPEEVLRRDVADHALCGWNLPHKYFSRIMWTEEHKMAGWQRPHDVCPDCWRAVVDRKLDPATLCLVPSAGWDWGTI